ncbi:MAG: HTH domain-containing protein [Candidatus Aenigmarchaeota archaeon]|nr:HTH domain-containing protein [Candidatus Aenigmarchaeota archaeon]
MEGRTGMKRDPVTIIEQIFNALENGRPFSINELAKETGIHNITIRKYVRIIEYVRREPQIEVIKTRHSIILRVRR